MPQPHIVTVLTVVGIMTLCLVVTKSSANDAFAATLCRPTIDLKADPGSVADMEDLSLPVAVNKL
jgi:hypothetical protein